MPINLTFYKQEALYLMECYAFTQVILDITRMWSQVLLAVNHSRGGMSPADRGVTGLSVSCADPTAVTLPPRLLARSQSNEVHTCPAN